MQERVVAGVVTDPSPGPELFSPKSGFARYWTGTTYSGREFEGGWLRGIVFLVECIVLQSLAVALAYLVALPLRFDIATQAFSNSLLVLSVAVWFAYFTIMYHCGASIGQRVLGCQVVAIKTGGQPTLARAALRTAALLPVFLPFVGLVYVLLVDSSGSRRGPHDFAAGTIVLGRPFVPGWRRDPWSRHEARYFDGEQWTRFVSDSGVEGIDDPRGGH